MKQDFPNGIDVDIYYAGQWRQICQADLVAVEDDDLARLTLNDDVRQGKHLSLEPLQYVRCIDLPKMEREEIEADLTSGRPVFYRIRFDAGFEELRYRFQMVIKVRECYLCQGPTDADNVSQPRYMLVGLPESLAPAYPSTDK